MTPQFDNLALRLRTLLDEWGADSVATVLAELVEQRPPAADSLSTAVIPPSALRSTTSIQNDPPAAPPAHTMALVDNSAQVVAATEAALRYQSRVLELVPNAVIVTDTAGIIRYWNHHATVVYQWESDETIGQPIIHFRLADAPPDVYHTMMEQLRAGRTWSGEFLGRRRDGSRFPAFTTNTPFLDHDGQVAGIIGVAVDMSARRELEERIRFQARALDAIGQAVAISDQHDNVTYWNQAAVALFGWTSDQALGHRLFELLGLKRRQFVVPAGDSTFEGEVLVQRADASLIPVLMTVSPVIDDGGTLIGRIAVASDLREQKRRHAQGLAFERKLQETQRLESLGVFAGGIAHDFNNLLTPMLGYAELASLEVAPESAVAQSIEQIMLSARHAADLVAQLLSYAGRSPLALQPLLLNDVIREMVELLQITVRNRATLVLELDPDVPAVLADPTQVRQVVLNLVANGAEAMQTGGPLTVRTSLGPLQLVAGEQMIVQSESPAQAGVYLAVTDQGKGMDAATQARIFEPFFTTRASGRGLGLAAVHGIVRAHQGGLSLLSAPGHGTTMRIWLPIAAEVARPQLASAPARLAHLAGSVLLIDDDAGVRGVVTQMLTHLGLRVFAADSAAAGLELLAQGIPQLRVVLIDVALPQLHGDLLAELITERNPATPVVLMTAYRSDELDTDSRRLPLAGVLQKPLQLTTLHALIERLPLPPEV